jgi:fructose-bisphosphate aldolase, class II
MKNLLDFIREAERNHVALGHFNFSDLAQLNGIIRVVERLRAPIVLGLSEGERDFVGLDFAVAAVRVLREKRKLPIFLNADHTYSLEKIREAVEAGVDSVIFDGAKLSLEENIEKTSEAVKIAKRISRKVLIEGEIGYIGQSSKILDKVPDEVDLEKLPTGLEAKEFVKKTRVDLLAPAVGNIHGMFGKAKNPRLQISLIREIRREAGVPLVLHGGSGVTDEDFVSAIDAGISLIHISTELRVAWRAGLNRELVDQPDEIAPYKVFKSVTGDVERAVEERVRIFSGL